MPADQAQCCRFNWHRSAQNLSRSRRLARGFLARPLPCARVATNTTKRSDLLIGSMGAKKKGAQVLHDRGALVARVEETQTVEFSLQMLEKPCQFSLRRWPVVPHVEPFGKRLLALSCHPAETSLR